ncbi:hypothetical protein GCM10011588_48460 [Nocardia jinanensis]|uniref:Uncharacterized protein n=2 Tax=Nocardia jinanensis TaxID=382504 RepID=A0A917RTT2_9NOCA|nr:DUF6086 family protein [Nocardia jinanensis]GGL27950.1 hypothetical protein GCM10011588_48460 [Nocardia jinanensis]
MSYIFDIEDVTVWSPALRVGKLYVGMARDLADSLGTSMGITVMASDFWEIELDNFDSFVRMMNAEYFSSEHPVLKVLVGAVLAPSIILLERGGNSIVPRSAEEREFFDRAHELSMPQ